MHTMLTLQTRERLLQELMLTPNPQTGATLDSTINQLKQLVPLVSALGGAIAVYFSLQGQITDIRTRMDLQNQQITQSLNDIKSDLKEVKLSQNDAQRRLRDAEINQLKQEQTRP